MRRFFLAMKLPVFFVILIPTQLNASEWEPVPPPPIDRALCITPVPGPGLLDTVYVGTDAWSEGIGGIWMSTDSGLTWVLKNGGAGGIPTPYAVTRIEIEPGDHRHLVTGFYEGIYITRDAGETWKFAGPEDARLFASALLIHPENPLGLLVGFDLGGFFLTPDEGGTWEEKINLAGFDDVIQNPYIPGHFYASVQGNFYISEDSGVSWSERSDIYAPDLAVNPDPPQEIYAVTETGIYRSTDEGLMWLPVGDSSPSASVIMVEPDSLLFAGGDGLFQSTDAGATWHELDPMFRQSGLREIESDERIPGRLWAATWYKGVYRSDDLGMSWHDVTIGADTAYVNTLAVLPWHPSSLVVGSDEYLARTGDLGETWHSLGGGFRWYQKLSFHPVDSLKALMGWNGMIDDLIVEFSEDGGRSWAPVLIQSFAQITDVRYHPASPETAFVSITSDSGLFYRSTDSGRTWNPFSITPHLGSGRYVFDPFDARRIFVYGSNMEGGVSVYRSLDGSATWHPSGTGLPEGVRVAALSPAPSRQNAFYLATGESSARVFISTNGGETWSESGELGTAKGTVRNLLVHPRDWDMLYALTSTGMYISRDGGAGWEDYNQGIEPQDTDLSSIAVDSTARHKVYVGGSFHTRSHAIYQRDLEPVGIEEPGSGGAAMPRAYQLFQNYPNPFNPQTTIAFDIPGERGAMRRVSLRIYDVRGRLVVTLVHSELGPGSHTVVWNGKDEGGRQVSSGAYLYNLETSEGTVTRKMIVLE